jgi:hypothetical protein
MKFVEVEEDEMELGFAGAVGTWMANGRAKGGGTDPFWSKVAHTLILMETEEGRQKYNTREQAQYDRKMDMREDRVKPVPGTNRMTKKERYQVW